MELFWKAAAVVILAIILGAAMGKSQAGISVALTVTTCCIVLILAMEYLAEVVGYLRQLGSLWDVQKPVLGILLKISCVALVTELTELISADAEMRSLGKAMQLLGNAAILCLSVPLFETFLGIIQEIMEFL